MSRVYIQSYHTLINKESSSHKFTNNPTFSNQCVCFLAAGGKSRGIKAALNFSTSKL